MSTHTLKDISTSTDRYKLFILICHPNELNDKIAFVKSQNINIINIGRELGKYIDSLEDFRYLNIDVYDFTKKLLDNHKLKINDAGNDLVAVHILGIILEPTLELNTTQLLKDFSKTSALIIVWENQSEIDNRLHWLTQENKIFLDFTETPLKKLQYAI